MMICAEGNSNLLPFQTKLVQKRDNLSTWDTESDVLSLLDVVRNVITVQVL